jgi:hypothetical protein
MDTASPLTVFVPKPAAVSYGEAMSRLRMWLDSQKMQLATFKLAPLGRVGFEISFRSEDDAIRFQGGFGWPLVQVPGPIIPSAPSAPMSTLGYEPNRKTDPVR